MDFIGVHLAFHELAYDILRQPLSYDFVIFVFSILLAQELSEKKSSCVVTHQAETCESVANSIKEITIILFWFLVLYNYNKLKLFQT